MVVDDEAVTLEILDTAGQGEFPGCILLPVPNYLHGLSRAHNVWRNDPYSWSEEYAAMADQWYKFGAGFLLVYSITDRPTFDSIRSFHADILRVKDRSYIPCVVVSNKVSPPSSSAPTVRGEEIV